MIRKGRLGPALAELVPDCALMIGSEPLLLHFIRPHHPTVQWFIELTRTNHPLTNPVHEGSSWDLKLASQFGWPPFIGQEPLTVPNSRAGCFHADLALQVRNHLSAKASGGTRRAKASLIECLRNRHRRPASFSQLLDLVANLRISREFAHRANGSDHDSLGLVAPDPLDPHPHLLAGPLHIDDDSLDDLPQKLFALGICGGGSSPNRGDIGRQATNGLSFRLAIRRRGFWWRKR